MFRLMLIAASTLIFVAALVSGAAAQDGGILSAPTTAFLFELAIATLAPLVFGLLAALLARLYALAGLKQTAENRATVEQILDRGLDLARKRYGKGGFIPLELEISAAHLVAQYAVDKGPQAFARFRITEAHDPRLHEMIEARLGDLMDPDTRVSGTVRPRPGLPTR